MSNQSNHSDIPSAIPYVFFGSATFSLYVLDELEKAGSMPSIIVTVPDKPVGRGLVMTPNAVKVWANDHNIPVLDPAKLDATFIENVQKKIGESGKIPCCIVAAYGKIIPQAVLDIPSHGMLNIHPSLLPRYRGATPIQSAMLDDVKNTGVTIMRVDTHMDHGPIVAQKAITVNEWPTYEVFEETLAREGGRLLTAILPDWIAGKVVEKEQNHAAATSTKKVVKEDGLITLDMEAFACAGNSVIADPAIIFPETQYEIFRKIQAYHVWPTVYFFLKSNGGKTARDKNSNDKKIRVKITSAEWHDNHLVIKKVIPEGKKETDFASFINSWKI